jgi:hypothetical protein
MNMCQPTFLQDIIDRMYTELVSEDNLQAATISVTKLNSWTKNYCTNLQCHVSCMHWRNHVQFILYSEFRKQRHFGLEFWRWQFPNTHHVLKFNQSRENFIGSTNSRTRDPHEFSEAPDAAIHGWSDRHEFLEMLARKPRATKQVQETGDTLARPVGNQTRTRRTPLLPCQWWC